MSERLTLGIDIGGTNFRIGSVNSDKEIVSFDRMPSSILYGNPVGNLALQIRNHISQNGLEGRVCACAIGLPAVLDKNRTTVLSAPNLKDFDNLALKTELEKNLGFPVYLGKDVNFLLQNDIEKLGLNYAQSVLGFYIGTGFGNAIYLDGDFYSGANGAAGELGHIPLASNELRCTCGNTGCIETVSSGKALEELTLRYFPQTDIKKVFKTHGGEPIIKAFVQGLAVPIAAEINLLDPQVCVIGGGVIQMEAFPVGELVEAVHFYTRKPYPEKELCILFAEHNSQSGVYGSGIFAQKQIQKQIKKG